MRVLVFHGYLLSGTGSNVYNANLAQAIARAGHEVHLLCQDHHAGSLPWVAATGDWDSGALRVTRHRPGSITAYRPPIGRVLPVYVSDRYEGFDAQTFRALSDAQIEEYVAANVAAIRELVAAVQPDVALANHLVMGPAILARALGGRVPYAVKVHGSALEYTVKPEPERFLPWAREGLAHAAAVLVGSRHTAESLWEAMSDPALPARTRLGPPGVDIGRFRLREEPEAREGLARLVARARERAAGGRGTATGAGSFVPDPDAALAALEAVQVEDDRLVLFVGKLIASKGVDLLLAAWPLVLSCEPRARLLVVGFGEDRESMERLAGALAAGDLDAAREAAAPYARTRAYLDRLAAGRGVTPPPLAREPYLAAARRGRVHFTGMLGHDALVDLLPVTDAEVVPSVFPEAFGMVAAEAAACGVLPVVADHSGLAEVARLLAPAVPAFESLLTFPLDPDPVGDLAARLVSWLRTPVGLREDTRRALAAVAAERFSWEGVACSVIAAAEGRLDDLPFP